MTLLVCGFAAEAVAGASACSSTSFSKASSFASLSVFSEGCTVPSLRSACPAASSAHQSHRALASVHPETPRPACAFGSALLLRFHWFLEQVHPHHPRAPADTAAPAVPAVHHR